MSSAYLGPVRTAVTKISLFPMTVTQIKSLEKDGIEKTQVGFGKGKKRLPASLLGHLKKSGLKSGKLKEIEATKDIELGTQIMPETVVKPGSTVNIQGVTKGKGFAGVVKRWNFAGGAKTHGQSDRLRAPGSIGQGTTPGRVHKGKKMAGHMGHNTYTIKNLTVIAMQNNDIWVTGPVPGVTKGYLAITVTGEKDLPTPVTLIGLESQAENI
ncbi:MAG: 50S ribosomal protein L3 [Microgenomates group bacterium GW2011_GWF2_47_9]|nr:MAG: 50S ribosomal protein L3 [Microgenomates group bacterium GW2011_GWF2_47_9]